MSYADMFRPNNMPVEQQVARIQAPQMPQFDLSQFFSMMPRQQAQAPSPAAAPAPQYTQYEPGMAIGLAPGLLEELGKNFGGMPANAAPAMSAPMQTPKFPSQAGMAARGMNAQAAGLSGGK